MRSHAETDIFTLRERGAFEAAQRFIARVGDPPPGAPPIRCHELAHAFGRFFGLPVVDGHFGIVDHSWVILPNPEAPKSLRHGKILDIYAVGALPQVMLLDACHYGLPYSAGYHPGPPRTDIDETQVLALMRLLGPPAPVPDAPTLEVILRDDTGAARASNGAGGLEAPRDFILDKFSRRT